MGDNAEVVSPSRRIKVANHEIDIPEDFNYDVEYDLDIESNLRDFVLPA